MIVFLPRIEQGSNNCTDRYTERHIIKGYPDRGTERDTDGQPIGFGYFHSYILSRVAGRWRKNLITCIA
jgi:hypothetical protein